MVNLNIQWKETRRICYGQFMNNLLGQKDEIGKKREMSIDA